MITETTKIEMAKMSLHSLALLLHVPETGRESSHKTDIFYAHIAGTVERIHPIFTPADMAQFFSIMLWAEKCHKI
jgi:hypothetical protein